MNVLRVIPVRKQLFALVLAPCIAFASAVHAQVQVRSPGDYTPTFLPANDDGSVGPVNLGFDINFFGLNTNQAYVNNNGNVTLDSSLSEYTPFDLTTTGHSIIAPFFADVDTRGAGSGIVSYGNATVDGHRAFIVNWPNVGYYSSHTDRLNNFQLVIIDRSDRAPGDFDFEFNYGQIQWETGDASGGTGGLGGNSARAGFSNGTGDPGTFFEIEGSGVNGAFLDSNLVTGLIHTSNIGIPGRYLFVVRNGIVQLGPTDDVLAVSLPSVSAAVSAAEAHSRDTLQTAANIARNYACVTQGGSPVAVDSHACLYAVLSGATTTRSHDGNRAEITGSAGILWHLSGGSVFGGGVTIGKPVDKTLPYDGDVDARVWGAHAFGRFVVVPDGLTLTGALFAGAVRSDIRRGYLIGTELQSSSRKTDGVSGGFLLRGEWPMPTPMTDLKLTPFAEFGIVWTKLDGYTETGGDFPARFDTLRDHSTRLLLGLEARRSFFNRGEAWASAAWAHEFDPRTANTSGEILGLRDFSYKGRKYPANRAQFTLGGALTTSESTRMIATISSDFAKGEKVRLTASVGVSVQLK